MMKLYDYPRSSAAFRLRIALNLKGISYQSIPVDLTRDVQKGAEYRELNPQGLVPALEEEGQVFVQSLAIIEYLDETHPEPPLLPGHPADRARVRALAQMVACDIHPLNNLRIRRYLADPLGHDAEAVATWQRHWMAEGFAAIEAILAHDGMAGSFCHGDEPSLADICLVPQCVNASRENLDMAPYPTIRRIFQTCMALDAFDQARADREGETR
jgi:maleylacetoacetate isomerase